MKFVLMALMGAVITAATLPAMAEYQTYENVTLDGLSRDGSWSYEEPGPALVMVCNVNGPDGYLSIRTCASSKCATVDQLVRLTIIEVDTRYRKGHWVRVRSAYQTHDEDGFQYDETNEIPAEGWAHDGYMCDFVS